MRLCLLFIVLAAAVPSAAEPITARQVVERIQKHSGVPWQGQTVDTFKAGDPDMRVAGIVTTFAATFGVLERAVASGKNLIITHEPTFYNHLDETKALEGDPVYAAKRAYIEKHGLVVWRFHDHWHRRRPDGILSGMTQALGWDSYRDPNHAGLFALPETTLADLAAGVEKRLGIRAMRVVGDPRMKATKVAFLPGAAGAEAQIHMLERDDVQVLLVGESREWETVEYVRDAVAEGRRKALVILGHVASEEDGMDECARWLRTFVTEVPIEFIPAAEPFWMPKQPLAAHVKAK